MEPKAASSPDGCRPISRLCLRRRREMGLGIGVAIQSVHLHLARGCGGVDAVEPRTLDPRLELFFLTKHLAQRWRRRERCRQPVRPESEEQDSSSGEQIPYWRERLEAKWLPTRRLAPQPRIDPVPLGLRARPSEREDENSSIEACCCAHAVRHPDVTARNIHSVHEGLEVGDQRHLPRRPLPRASRAR